MNRKNTPKSIESPLLNVTEEHINVDDSHCTQSPTVKKKSLVSSQTPTQKTLPKDNCPCRSSQPQQYKIKCAKCKQMWHIKCANLDGLDSRSIKKLETWECPSCYICPHLCNVPATLYTEFQSVKDIILSNSVNKYEDNACVGLKEEINLLRLQVAELEKASLSPPVPQLLPTILSNLEQLTPDTIPNIEKSLTDLNSKLSGIEHVNSVSKSSSTVTKINEYTSPNTVSPNAKKSVTPCKSYLDYQKSAISPDTRNSVLEYVKVNESDFKAIGKTSSRDVMYFGEHEYRYSGQSHPAKALPDFTNKLLEEIKPLLPAEESTIFNSCLISRYKTGENHIPYHRDDEPVIAPESLILTISFGADRTMSFRNNDGSQQGELALEDSSFLLTSRYAQDFWQHGILPDDSTEERISLTFRHIAPYFINSTIILGDSNTSRINFGSGKGTLGSWMPGKRVKAGHIEAIPKATDIGPYRNIVIHTGVNSINVKRFRKSNTYLIHCIESKCKDILEVYPKSKVYVSLLLPTRSHYLNNEIRELNKEILNLTYRLGNVSIIENSIFGDVLTDEFGRWDVKKNQPFTDDSLHLGKLGIRHFAMNIKNTVLGRTSVPQDRLRASGGSYRDAMDRGGHRGGHRDGYQSS